MLNLNKFKFKTLVHYSFLYLNNISKFASKK